MKAVLVCVIAAVLLQGYTVHGQDVLILSSTGTADEGIGPWILTVEVAGGGTATNDIDIELDVVLDDGDDIPLVDEMLTITLLAGTSSISQSYTILDNNNIFPTETRRFIVEAVILVPTLADFMVGNDPNNLQDRDSAILTIRDDDAVIVEFTQPTFPGSEDSQSATVSLRLAAGSAIVPAPGLTVDLTASPGSVGPNGASVADYDPDSASVFFAAGQGPGAIQSFSFDIIDDNLVESPESFSVEGDVSMAAFAARFSNGQPTDTVTVNIADNDAVIVEFTANSYDGSEDTQTAIVTLQLAANSAVVPTGGFTVQLSSAPGSATVLAPADYSAIPAPNPVQFLAGDGPLTQRSSTFTIIDDSIVEPLESFSATGSVTAAFVTFSNGLNADTVNVNIVDNDVVTVAFVPAAYTVREDQGPVSVCLRIIEGSLAPGVTATVSIDSADGTATQPNDYPQVVSRVITFPGSRLGGIEECTPIAVVDDGIDETPDTEDFFLDLTPGTNSAIGNPGRATVTIIDSHLICSFSAAAYDVDEGDTATLMVTLQGQAFSMPVDKFINCQGDTATAGVDFTAVPLNQVVTFPAGSTAPVPVTIDTLEDSLKETDETFTCTLSDSPNPPVVTIGSPSTATITIRDDDDCTIGLITGPPPPTVPIAGATDCYMVDEHLGPATAYVGIISGSLQGRQVTVTLSTSDGTATGGSVSAGGVDYFNVVQTLTFTSSVTYLPVDIPIRDDLDCEVAETIIIELTTLDNDVTLDPGVGCVTIEDDEDCCPTHQDCHPNAICEELPGPDNFTCVCPPPLMGDGMTMCMMGVGDDPHFSIGLPDGKMLCYTVQGEHGFAFNLISNEKVYMNAKFVPDSRRDEVTWLGSMGITVQTNGYKKANATAMRFEAIENKIYINDKIELKARSIDKLTFEDGKLMISEAPPVEDFKYPRVLVDLKDVELRFSVAFMNEHLDLYWHSTGQQTADSHGLIGQFFRKGIELDEVRKILILPGKEPVPVMRRPVWSFMEREMPDDQLCWTAMNPGYQGEGLIDGTYYDYVVNDVLSTGFKFKKQK